MATKYPTDPTKLSQQEIEGFLQEWSDSYYNTEDAKSIAPDNVYDLFKDYLEAQYPDSTFLKVVGAPVKVSEWEKMEHEIPMGSLDKVHNVDDIKAWSSSIGAKNFWITEKLDGISIELLYDDGNLTAAITRGNGKVGENILANVQRMKNVKRKLAIPFNGTIRGEIILRKSEFAKLSSDGYSNPRNAASGIARRYDGTQAEHLEILYYDIIAYDTEHEDQITSEASKIKFIKGLGVKALEGEVVDLKKADKVYEDYKAARRAKLDYEIDGLVLKVNDLDIANKINDTATSDNSNPKAQRAWKFDQPMGISKLKKILWSTGKGGSVTPVAFFEPISLAGASVQMASMHNLSIAEDLNVNTGDEIIVIRANDVIPQVLGIHKKHNNKKIEVPTVCGECGKNLHLETSQTKDRVIKTLHCINEDCPKLKLGKIIRLIEVFEIKDFSESRIQALYDAGFVKDAADLFTFDRAKAANLEGFGKRIFDKLDKHLEEKSKVSLSQFLAALGIRTLGRRQWKKVVDAGHDSWDKIETLMHLPEQNFVTELSKIKGLGEEICKMMYQGLVKNKSFASKLLQHLTIKKSGTADGKLRGLNLCFTGLRKFNGVDLAKLIQSEGGAVRNSVSKNLDMLIVADLNSGSSKMKKAKDQGVKCIEVEDFFKQFGFEAEKPKADEEEDII